MTYRDPGDDYAAAVISALETGEDVTARLRRPRSDWRRNKFKAAMEMRDLKAQEAAREQEEAKIREETREPMILEQTIALARVILIAGGESDPEVECVVSAYEYRGKRISLVGKFTGDRGGALLVRASGNNAAATSKRFIASLLLKAEERIAYQESRRTK